MDFPSAKQHSFQGHEVVDLRLTAKNYLRTEVGLIELCGNDAEVCAVDDP